MTDDQGGCLLAAVLFVGGFFVLVGVVGLLIIGWHEVLQLIPHDG